MRDDADTVGAEDVLAPIRTSFQPLSRGCGLCRGRYCPLIGLRCLVFRSAPASPHKRESVPRVKLARMLNTSKSLKASVAVLSAALLLGACGGWTGRAPERGPIVAVLPANNDPYSRAAHEGLKRIEQDLGIPTQVLQPADGNDDPLGAALRAAADSEATLLVAVGETPRQRLLDIAEKFPTQRFAVIDADTTRENVAAYDLMEQQAAWLAGAAAGLLTRSNVVGYASPDDNATTRQAFADGLAASNRGARLVTRGNNSGASEWAGAVHAASREQADILYLVGSQVPASAYAAATEANIAVIVDRHTREGMLRKPVIAATVTDPGEAIFEAGRDLYDAMWKGGIVRRLGVTSPNAVGLVLARGVPAEVHEQLEVHRKQLAVRSAPAPAGSL